MIPVLFFKKILLLLFNYFFILKKNLTQATRELKSPIQCPELHFKQFPFVLALEKSLQSPNPSLNTILTSLNH